MSSFSRVFMRAARYQRGVNPVQNALGLQGTSRYMNGVRNYAAFTRDKPHVNIGIHPSHHLKSIQLIICRNHRSRRSRKGTILPFASTPRDPPTNNNRLPSQPPSPSDKPRRAMQSSSSMAPSTKRPRSASVVSPSQPPTSSTRPTTAITPTSTAPVTPITSRT
jgi:hypothetical protein